MNKRNLLIFLVWVLCFGAAWAVFAQRRELIRLRAQQEHAGEQATESVNYNPSETKDSRIAINIDTLAEAESRELMRLRNEVTRLNARKRELAAVAETHQQLRAQLETASTNATGNRLPPGYIRKAEAQFVGYSTPENTVQSFLWALQHHDVNALLQSLSPDNTQWIESAGGPDSFFKQTDAMPGLAIRGRNNIAGGSVELEVEFGPSMSDKLRLRSINGEWKLDNKF
jgi:hypothetical protein